MGPNVGSYYEVIEGLQEGERIVTSGTFLLDSESKLMASSNMMGSLGMGGIKMEQAQMGQMDMDMKAPEMGTGKKSPDGRIEKKVERHTLVFSTDPTHSTHGRKPDSGYRQG